MLVIVYTGLICDDAYKLTVSTFEILGYATVSLSKGRRISLTGEIKG